mgnify:CR=1 FL=1
MIVSKEKFNDKNRIPILSPGPREAELSSDTDDMDNVIFTKQAYNGLLIRMSLLYYFLHYAFLNIKKSKQSTHLRGCNAPAFAGAQRSLSLANSSTGKVSLQFTFYFF